MTHNAFSPLYKSELDMSEWRLHAKYMAGKQKPALAVPQHATINTETQSSGDKTSSIKRGGL